MSVNVSFSNYNGRQPNSSSYIKNFISGSPTELWKAHKQITVKTPIDGQKTLTAVISPANLLYSNLLIPGNLYVGGTIYNSSDLKLKENIQDITIEETNKLLNIRPTTYNLKNEKSNITHYGFIAQELQEELPELVTTIQENNFSKTSFLK